MYMSGEQQSLRTQGQEAPAPAQASSSMQHYHQNHWGVPPFQTHQQLVQAQLLQHDPPIQYQQPQPQQQQQQQQHYHQNNGHTRLPIVVHTHDVLCGRGVNIAQHPGNERFRALVNSRYDKDYCDTYSTSEKRAVAEDIIGHIKSLNPPGRFLQRSGRSRNSRGLEGPWDELSHRDAVKKTCQALRDCSRQDRSGYAAAVSVPDDVRQIVQQRSQIGLTNKQLAQQAAAAAVKQGDDAASATSSQQQQHPEKRSHDETVPDPSLHTSGSLSPSVENAAEWLKKQKIEIPDVTPMASSTTPTTAATTGGTHENPHEGTTSFPFDTSYTTSPSTGAPSSSFQLGDTISSAMPSPATAAFQYSPNPLGVDGSFLSFHAVGQNAPSMPGFSGDIDPLHIAAEAAAVLEQAGRLPPHLFFQLQHATAAGLTSDQNNQGQHNTSTISFTASNTNNLNPFDALTSEEHHEAFGNEPV